MRRPALVLRPLLHSAAVTAAIAIQGCATAPPATVHGVPSTSRAPGTQWTPPASAAAPLTPAQTALGHRSGAAPDSSLTRLMSLSLDDAVDLALTGNPATRVSWAQARAAAATLGSVNGRFLPTITGDITGGPSRAISANPAFLPANRRTLIPSVSLQYLLFDFGGRSNTSRAAREALFAADFTHNATVQAVLLQVQQAFFAFQSARGVFRAAIANIGTARRNLDAAENRRAVGLATIGDVLQARTALAQAELAAQGADGDLQGARATLGRTMGLEANRNFDATDDSTDVPVLALSETVDSLIARAERERPDLAAARALVRQGEAQVAVARSGIFPTVTLGSAVGRNFSNITNLEGRTYGLTVGVQVPIFSGNTRQYDIVVARENAAAAAARAEQARLDAAAQVFTSYHVLRTAAMRVTTSRSLLETATQSEEVARGRYAAGVGSILDVLLAQNALADARAQAVTARWSWSAALAQLARDVGAITPVGPAGLRFLSDSTRRTP